MACSQRASAVRHQGRSTARGPGHAPQAFPGAVQGRAQHDLWHGDVAVALVQGHVGVLPAQAPASGSAAWLISCRGRRLQPDRRAYARGCSCVEAGACTEGAAPLPRGGASRGSHPSTSGTCRDMCQCGHSCTRSLSRYCARPGSAPSAAPAGACPQQGAHLLFPADRRARAPLGGDPGRAGASAPAAAVGAVTCAGGGAPPPEDLPAAGGPVVLQVELDAQQVGARNERDLVCGQPHGRVRRRGGQLVQERVPPPVSRLDLRAWGQAERVRAVPGASQGARTLRVT